MHDVVMRMLKLIDSNAYYVRMLDLQSMMLECSDLSAPIQARSVNKKPAVRDVHIAKPSSMTYNESRSARHWSADQQEDLSKLFTLPGKELIYGNFSESFNCVLFLKHADKNKISLIFY